MKDRYDPIIEQGDKATTNKEKLSCAWTMLKVMGGNHLPTIEGKINKLTWLIVALLIAVLFSSKDSISWVYMIIMKLF